MAAARIVVHGAGSVGCFIGGCWQAAGLPVGFIGRTTFANDIDELISRAADIRERDLRAWPVAQ